VLEDEWEAAAEYVRAQLTAELARYAIPFPEDPVVLCWRAVPTESQPDSRPTVWPAWGAKMTWEIGYVSDPPPWAYAPTARLLVTGATAAFAACAEWPEHSWFFHWHPTARARDAARRHGITAQLVGGPASGQRFHLEALRPDIRVHSRTGWARFGEYVYTRDPEPSGLANDGTALWFYRARER
jgi:hypothetical protein